MFFPVEKLYGRKNKMAKFCPFTRDDVISSFIACYSLCPHTVKFTGFCYEYNKPIRGAIFNFNKLVSDLDIETCTPDS